MNRYSSRSHAVCMVNVQRTVGATASPIADDEQPQAEVPEAVDPVHPLAGAEASGSLWPPRQPRTRPTSVPWPSVPSHRRCEPARQRSCRGALWAHLDDAACSPATPFLQLLASFTFRVSVPLQSARPHARRPRGQRACQADRAIGAAAEAQKINLSPPSSATSSQRSVRRRRGTAPRAPPFKVPAGKGSATRRSRGCYRRASVATARRRCCCA